MRLWVTFLGAALAVMMLTSNLSSIKTEGTGGVELICKPAKSKGSFGKHLQSITWNSPQKMAVCLENTCVSIEKSSLTVNSATVKEDITWTFSESRMKMVLLEPEQPVRSIYFFHVKMGGVRNEEQRKWLLFYMQDGGLLVEAIWHDDVGFHPFAMIHGPEREDGQVPYMIGIEWDNLSKHFIFYSMTLNPNDEYRVNRDQKGKHYFATWAPGLENTLRLVPAPEGAPSRNAFSTLPQGTWTDNVANGTLFLFDDEKGCAYAVLGWKEGTDLAALYDQDNHRSLDFPVVGTPYEKFFQCPDEFKVSANLDGGRCQVVGEEAESGLRRSELFIFLGVALALLAVLALMVFCACKYAKGLVLKNSFKKKSGKSGKAGGRGSKASTESTQERSQSSKLKVSSQLGALSSPKSRRLSAAEDTTASKKVSLIKSTTTASD